MSLVLGGSVCQRSLSFRSDGCTSNQKFLDITFGLSGAAQIVFQGEKLNQWFLNITFQFCDAADIVFRDTVIIWLKLLDVI